MCTIEPHILGVQTFGNVAVVFTLEVPRKGADQRDTKKAAPASANAHHDRTQDPRPMQGPLPDLPMLLSKMFFPQLGSRNKQTSSSSSPEHGGSPASKSPSRILSMTTLRHTNQMWRIWSHHTTMIDSAAFLGNAVDIAALVREKQTVEREADAAANVSDDGLDSQWQPRRRRMKNVMADMLSAVTQVASSMNRQPRTKHRSSLSAPFSVEVDSEDDDDEDDDEMKNDGGAVEGDEDVADFEPLHPSDYPLTRVVLDMIREANRQGYLSSEHREVLTDHLIHGLVTNQQSAVEVAYEVIFGYNLPPGMSKSPRVSSHAVAAAATLKRFADQCKRLASQLPPP
jgi:hypothetical protein